MKKYIIGAHFITACENAYFLVDESIYNFITGRVFKEDILRQLAECFADYESEIPAIKAKFQKDFHNENLRSLVNTFSWPKTSEVFGYKIHDNILSLINEIADMKISVLASDVDVIIGDEVY